MIVTITPVNQYRKTLFDGCLTPEQAAAREITSVKYRLECEELQVFRIFDSLKDAEYVRSKLAELAAF